MKKTILILATSLLATCGTIALAQTAGSSGPPTASQVIDDLVTSTEGQLVLAAEAMPEEKYSFAPSNGAFKGVRTFAEQVTHLAANNYRMAAMILGQKPTADQEAEQGPDSVRTKAEVVDYLEGSFVALHKAVATIDETNLVQPIREGKRVWQRVRLGLAMDAVAHSFDHYGQMVEYLRMNSIIPPDSR